MTRGLPIQRCTACERAVFPPRLACPACGGRGWRTELAESGVAEEVAVVRHRTGHGAEAPRAIASVRTDAGPLLVAAADPGLPAGSRIELWRDGAVLRAIATGPAVVSSCVSTVK